jgi:hypothetical protein
MRTPKLIAIALLAAAIPACTSANMNVKKTPPQFPSPLLADGLLTTDGLREYDGNIIDFNFLGTGERKGELFSIEIWPYATVGIGLFGARVQVLPLELGAGILFYEPSAKTGIDTDDVEAQPMPEMAPEPEPESESDEGDSDAE